MLFVLCGALFLDALDVSMKGVALPAIGSDLGIAAESLQWVVSGYVLGFAGFLLLGGRAADLFGRRRMFLWSLGVFLIASAFGGLTESSELLVAARFVTGVSAAFTAPAGLSIITTAFAEGPARNRALSVYSATGASGFSFGLVAGGLLTDVSWRLVFFVPVAVAAATLAAAIRLVPKDGDHQRWRGFDLAGALSSTAAMLLLVWTLTEAQDASATRTVSCLAAVAALLVLFVRVESRSASPLVRSGLLRAGPLARANVAAMALLGGWVGCLFILTLYMQEVRGWSALATGLAVCPSGIVVALLAPRIGAPLVSRFGAPKVILAGLGAAALAYALLLPIASDTGYVSGMLPAFLLVGLAFSLAYGPLNIIATSGVSPDEHGVAGGLVNTAFQLGPALVLAAVTAVIETDDLRSALLVPLAVSLLGMGTALVSVRKS
ncbi:MFS transporter [Streptomyces sp. S.PB5]|uniref:MFS transporter n=1 Tax=Streptomyces sp. S.PB5 TaxID=3020844 RepID=UPI0025B1EB22|nr:MFS transporter [Streptomyces sp. S.PB5]MDN3027594.1 MFS transporter [Streptomyces sp. S.PB5]